MAELKTALTAAEAQLNAVIVGKKAVVRLVLCCLLARGHLLLEDLPGAGKTTLAKALAATVGLSFRRVQFTADLLPADILGFSMPTPEGNFAFHPGPIFCGLLLADEINRASPKSQSALLEAMAERQVSVENQTHALDEAFFVFATQNPSEQVGTYPLPESQLDRFLMRLSLGYPDENSEVGILCGKTPQLSGQQLSEQLSRAQIIALQHHCDRVTVAPTLARYVQKLLHQSRESGLFQHGLSTRAGLAVVRAARAWALLEGQRAVLPEHVQAVFAAVVAHRLTPRSQTPQAAVEALLAQVAVPL